jgi:hypothetical protein
MERIVYSFATFAFWSASKSGSTEVTFDVSWEKEIKLIAQKTKASGRERYRCMIMNSVSKAMDKSQFAEQINGKFQTVLLNPPVLSRERFRSSRLCLGQLSL